MCLICIEYNKNKITLNEAWKNLHEMSEVIGEKHTWEVIEKLWEEELKNEEGKRSKLNSKN